MKKINLLILIFLCISGLFAQKKGAPITIGVNHTIKSSVLNQDRVIQIHTPENYSDSKKEYPVLYILDGQRFFGHVVSLSNTFKQFNLTPEFIII